MEGEDNLETSKELIDIAVMHVVNGGKYWISEPSGINMSQQRAELVVLEDKLAKQMLETYDSISVLNANKLLAVKNEQTGHWHRGELLSPLPDSRTSRVRVFLIDHGAFLVNVKVEHVQPLPEEMHNLPPQAFVTCLFGLIPLTVNVNLEDANDKFHYEKSPVWTPVSETLAHKMLKESTSAHLKVHIVEGRTAHGEIFFNMPRRGLISLNKALCKEKYAFYSEEEYKKVVEHEAEIEMNIIKKKQALMKAEEEREGNALQCTDIKKIKHMMMEDFLKEYANKKLLKQEKVAQALNKIRQGTHMRGLQADSSEKQEDLDAGILSAAPKFSGRGSFLKSVKESNLVPQRGRGLPLSALGKTHDQSCKSNLKSLIDLLGTINSNPNEGMGSLESKSPANESRASMKRIPAGYPIDLIETETKKKKVTNDVQKSSWAVKSHSTLESGRCLKRPTIVKPLLPSGPRNERISGDPLKSSGDGALGSTLGNFVSSHKSESNVEEDLSSRFKMGDNFVEMCKLYAKSSSSVLTSEGNVRMSKKMEGKPISPLCLKAKTANSKERDVHKSFSARDNAKCNESCDSKIKNIIENHSRSINSRMYDGVVIDPKSVVNSFRDKDGQPLKSAGGDISKSQHTACMQVKNDDYSIVDSESLPLRNPPSMNSRSEIGESEHITSKQRKPKGVNPLFSLLDMIKKKGKTQVKDDSRNSSACSSPQDCDSVSEETGFIQIEASSVNGYRNSSSTVHVNKIFGGVSHPLENLVNDRVSLPEDKGNLRNKSENHQACDIPFAVSVTKGEHSAESPCISNEENLFPKATRSEPVDADWSEKKKPMGCSSYPVFRTTTKGQILVHAAEHTYHDIENEARSSRENSYEYCSDVTPEKTEDVNLPECDLNVKSFLSENDDLIDLNTDVTGIPLKEEHYLHSATTLNELIMGLTENEGVLCNDSAHAAFHLEEPQPVMSNSLESLDNKDSKESDSMLTAIDVVTESSPERIHPNYTVAPTIGNGPEASKTSDSTSKPGISKSIDRFFKLFQPRKQMQVNINIDQSKLATETKSIDGDEVFMSDDNASSLIGAMNQETSVDKKTETKSRETLEMKKVGVEMVSSLICEKDQKRIHDCGNLVSREEGSQQTAGRDHQEQRNIPSCDSHEVEGNKEPAETKGNDDLSFCASQESDSCNNSNNSDKIDDFILREMHYFAKSWSKLEAEKNSKTYDAIKKGIPMDDLTVRLPLHAAQESMDQSRPQRTPMKSILSEIKSYKQSVTVMDDKIKEINIQKTFEPVVVRPSKVNPPTLPPLLSKSWASDAVKEDWLLTDYRVKMCRVLIRGHLLAQPIESIAQVPFKCCLHMTLSKIGYRDPMRIQRYTWPALMRGHNLVVINPRHSGKTLGYLVPIISFMLSPDLYSELPAGNGPLVLILCPSWNDVVQINDYCQFLMENAELPTRIIPVYGGLEGEQTIPLFNGCEILITTPKCFLRLLGSDRFITNMDRLCHLVFDEADTLMKKFLPEVREVLRECKLVLRRRARAAAKASPSGDSESYQTVKLIAAAKTWCPQMESFVTNIIENPLLCIGSYLEAAVYADLKPTLHIVGYQACLKQDGIKPSEKSKSRQTEVDNIVLGILEKSMGFEKFVVACESVDVVKRLTPKIIKIGANLLVVHENQHHTDIAERHHMWMSSRISGSLPVLLISDKTLAEFNIGDAEHLVHVGIPAFSKTHFGLRFSTLMDNYRDIFNKHSKVKNCSVDIVVDITEPEVEIYGLIDFLQRLGMTVPPELETAAEKSNLCKEMIKKKDLLLCPNIKSFGECSASCNYRHAVLPDIDQPSEGLPTCGEVRLKILHVLDASHLSARVLEHIHPDGTRVLCPDNYYNIASGLARHFRIPDNRFPSPSPGVGDICALETEHNLFQRAQVEAITECCMGNKTSVTLTVNLIDEGTKKVVKDYQLWYLPEELKKYPPQAKEVIVCRLMPRDLDLSWSHAACGEVANMIEVAAKGELDGQEIIGVVVLALKNTLWVDPLECREWLEKQKTTVIHMSLRRDLVHLQLTVDNPEHVQKLMKLCNIAGISLPTNDTVSVNRKSISTDHSDGHEIPEDEMKHTDKAILSSWESMNIDKLITVNVVSVHSPFCFSVQKVSSSDDLAKLSEDIQSWISSVWKTSLLESSGIQKEDSIGSICLGFCKADDSWCRAKVVSIKNNFSPANVSDSFKSDNENSVQDEEEILYEVYFVDYGDSALVSSSELAPIPDELILQLPFQSIECSLMGVRPNRLKTEHKDCTDANEEWDEEASNVFYKLCRDVDDVDLYRPLLAKAFGSDGHGVHGGMKYLVVLYDKSDKQVKRIGESLVQGGFAESCEIIVDGGEFSDDLDDECMDLQSHWIGEGALLPFTSALENGVESHFDEEPSTTNAEVPPSEKALESRAGTDYTTEEDDSESFEIVMSDDEIKLYEERLRDFLGFPLRPKEASEHEEGNYGLRAIMAKEVTAYGADDQSSLTSYEIIPDSPTQSGERFEEITEEGIEDHFLQEADSPAERDSLNNNETARRKTWNSSLEELQTSTQNEMVGCLGLATKSSDGYESSSKVHQVEAVNVSEVDLDGNLLDIARGFVKVDGSVDNSNLCAKENISAILSPEGAIVHENLNDSLNLDVNYSIQERHNYSEPLLEVNSSEVVDSESGLLSVNNRTESFGSPLIDLEERESDTTREVGSIVLNATTKPSQETNMAEQQYEESTALITTTMGAAEITDAMAMKNGESSLKDSEVLQSSGTIDNSKDLKKSFIIYNENSSDGGATVSSNAKEEELSSQSIISDEFCEESSEKHLSEVFNDGTSPSHSAHGMLPECRLHSNLMSPEEIIVGNCQGNKKDEEAVQDSESGIPFSENEINKPKEEVHTTVANDSNQLECSKTLETQELVVIDADERETSGCVDYSKRLTEESKEIVLEEEVRFISDRNKAVMFQNIETGEVAESAETPAGIQVVMNVPKTNVNTDDVLTSIPGKYECDSNQIPQESPEIEVLENEKAEAVIYKGDDVNVETLGQAAAPNDSVNYECNDNSSSVEMYGPLPCLLPARTPLVKWFQNKWEVILTVDIPNMKHYNIIFQSNKNLYIHASSGRAGEPSFALGLQLWASVNVEEFEHMVISHNTIKVILPKAFVDMEWPRLLISTNKPLWLSVDFDRMDYDLDEVQDEVSKEVINYKSSDDDSGSEYEETLNEVRCEEVNYDPYDPFG